MDINQTESVESCVDELTKLRDFLDALLSEAKKDPDFDIDVSFRFNVREEGLETLKKVAQDILNAQVQVIAGPDQQSSAIH